MLRRVWARLAATVRPRHLDDQFEEEVREHLELLQDRFTRQGMAPDAAFYAARRQFGGVTRLGQEMREQRGVRAIDGLLRDFHYAGRQLLRAKSFTASAVMTLALGIGATTAVFAVMHAVVLRPLPFGDPDRIMAFRSSIAGAVWNPRSSPTRTSSISVTETASSSTWSRTANRRSASTTGCQPSR